MPKDRIPGKDISGMSFNKKDLDIAKLKLAIAKRNFKYIDSYKTLAHDPFPTIKELRLPDESLLPHK